jgi:carbonic anhydrase/acetyltransferase-like protein (isoleucine patch superfamily)
MPLYEVNNRRPVIGEGCWIAPSAEVIGDVRLGKDVYVGFGAIVRGDYGTIIIGDGSAVEENVTIHARPAHTATIGKNVTIGHMAMIHGATIKDFAVIGMQSVIADFAEVGEWAIIAEQAMVPNKMIVPGYKIYAGVPAKEIGNVEEKHKQLWSLAKQVYQDLTRQYPTGLKRID